MSVSVVCSPAAPRATIDFCTVLVDDAAQNVSTSPTDTYPVQAEVRYYIAFELASVEKGRSYVFGVSEDGGHLFANYVFPEDGEWTVNLRKASDDTSVATDTVTVS